MLTTTRERLGAASGALFVVLIFAGNTLDTAGTVQSGHASGAQVLRDVEHQAGSTTATVGFALELLSFVAFMVFLGYLVGLFRFSRAGGAAAGTAVVAGVTMLAVKLGSGSSAGVLALDRRSLTPQLARLLNDLSSTSFVISWLPFAVFVGALAIGLRTAGLAGRPTAYSGMVLGVAGVALTLVGLRNPVDANPFAFLLGLVWLVVISVRLAVGRTAGATTEQEPTYDGAPAHRLPVST
jgi:hypothetical protein